MPKKTEQLALLGDERAGKISGSGIAAYAACAGRFQLEQQVPKQPSGPAAELGNRVHSVLAGAELDLPDDEMEIASACRAEYKTVVQSLGRGIEKTVYEDRIWYRDIWSGQIDRIDFFTDTTALVVDWKTGRIAQSAASENLQLRAYAVLVKHRYPSLKKIYAAIIQPMAGPTTIAEYDRADLEAAEKQINEIVEKAMSPNAPRTPSPDACKYCRAKTICPEAQATTMSLVESRRIDVPALNDVQLSDYLEKAEVVEDFIEALKIEAKRRLLAGSPVRGYALANGATTRSVADTDAAYAKVRDIVPPHSFATCCKLSLPKLEKLIAVTTAVTEKEAKQKVSTLLGDLIVAKQGEQKMIRK
jgi:CRISPR/Cas system-associated exonuclease Cas4 (RecB family)